ncbi:MAG: hypothetical protein ABMB14_32320 [Myxococcota bacterium]
MATRDDEPENSADDPAEPSEGSEPGPVLEDETAGAGESNRSRMLKFARRLMDRKEIAEDTKVLLSAVLSTSDKAKTEAVRMMAREFRSYLKELKLKEDLLKLATSHSLEISIHLKPLAPAGPRDDDGK